MNNPLSFTRSRRVRYLGGAIVALFVSIPGGARGQGTAPPNSPSISSVARLDGSYPQLKKRQEVPLLGAGVALIVASFLAPSDHRVVPVEGLDPAAIRWSRDRAVIGNQNLRAGTISDWTRNGAIVLPALLTLMTVGGSEGRVGLGRSSLVFTETFLVSQGLTMLGKRVLGRARPYAYLPEGDRPDNAKYDVSMDRTFRAMPSGHSSSAWTGAAMGITEYLLRRPNAEWVNRSGVAFLGGALAGATSALRVEAGQHFLSDVLVGAGIGIGTGVSVPMLHHGDQPLPSTKAWLQVTGGVLAGTLLGVVLVNGF